MFRYNFRLLDTFGWNFRHAHFHEEGRRTLYKAYGIKFVIIVQGRAGEAGIFSQYRREGYYTSFPNSKLGNFRSKYLVIFHYVANAIYFISISFKRGVGVRLSFFNY